MSDEEKDKPFVLDMNAISNPADIPPEMAKLLEEVKESQRKLASPMGDLQNVLDEQRRLLDSLRLPIDKGILGDFNTKKVIDDLVKSPLDGMLSQISKPLRSPANLGQEAFEGLSRPSIEVKPLWPNGAPPLPKNPVLETNERLSQLEAHFTQMLNVMTNAAAIGTALQGNANDFLGKFEKASEDTDKSARRAIRVGVIAILIAILTPVFQIAYSSYQDHTEMKLDRLTEEIVKLREGDVQAGEKLLNELQSSNASVNERLISQLRTDGEANREILRRVEQSLSEMKTVTKGTAQ